MLRNSTDSVLSMIQATLINVYTNLDPSLQPQSTQINESFIQECLDCINSQEGAGGLKCVSQMMGTFFEGTELNGIGDVRMHK